MQLATIDDVPHGSPGVRLSSGEFLHLLRFAVPGSLEVWIPSSIKGLLEAGQAALGIVRGMIDRCEALQPRERELLRGCGTLLPAATRLLPPIVQPSMILAAGLAYRSHLAEMAGTPAPPHPTAFMKSPSSLSAPGALVAFPKLASARVDFEGELACVFGRHCHNVSASDALSYLAGYTASNDLSARDWVESAWQAREPWAARVTWEVNLMGKQFPGFTALGPVLTTTDEIQSPADLRLTTRLNGQIMQDSLVNDLIFSIGEMIAHFSRWYRFAPGDILLTGTPAGVGVGRKPPVFIKAGDCVEVEIGRIGCLRTVF